MTPSITAVTTNALVSHLGAAHHAGVAIGRAYLGPWVWFDVTIVNSYWCRFVLEIFLGSRLLSYTYITQLRQLN